jgi:hypothetical protein
VKFQQGQARSGTSKQTQETLKKSAREDDSAASADYCNKNAR